MDTKEAGKRVAEFEQRIRDLESAISAFAQYYYSYDPEEEDLDMQVELLEQIGEGLR